MGVNNECSQGNCRDARAVYRCQKNIAVLRVTVLYTVGLLNSKYRGILTRDTDFQ